MKWLWQLLAFIDLRLPGSDGLPIKFHAQYNELLTPKLLALYDLSFRNFYPFPPLRDATIVLIHKPGKDLGLPESYRPISLLQVDIKILAKILALRLNQVILTRQVLCQVATPHLILDDCILTCKQCMPMLDPGLLWPWMRPRGLTLSDVTSGVVSGGLALAQISLGGSSFYIGEGLSLMDGPLGPLTSPEALGRDAPCPLYCMPWRSKLWQYPFVVSKWEHSWRKSAYTLMTHYSIWQTLIPSYKMHCKPLNILDNFPVSINWDKSQILPIDGLPPQDAFATAAGWLH